MRITLISLIAIFSLNTLDAGIVWKYFEDCKKRVNKFTNRVEWYREKKVIISEYDYNSHYFTQAQVKKIDKKITELIDQCNYTCVDSKLCQRWKLTESDSESSFIWNHEKRECINSYTDERWFLEDGCSMDSLENKTFAEKLEIVHTQSLTEDYLSLRNKLKKNNKDISKKDKKKLKSIIQELNDMVPSKKIELIKTIYPKGWTTNPEYLD